MSQDFKKILVFIITLFLVITLPDFGFTNVNNTINANRKVKNASNIDLLSDSRCIMLIHGFGGSPHDLKPLTQVLDSLDMNYYAVTLAGHGTHPKDLRNVRHQTWIVNCFETFDSLSTEYDSITLIGFSMGGALSLLISAKRDVSKLILLSPYFRTHKKWYYFGKPELWAKRFSSIIPYIRKLKIGQINDPVGLKKYKAYDKLPLNAISELVKVGKLALEKGSIISCPVLWMHSESDIVSDYRLSLSMFNECTSENKTFIEFTKSNHILLYDYNSDEVIRQIIKFLSDDDDG